MHNITLGMIQALIQLIFTPEAAWRNLFNDAERQHYLLPMLVYPLLFIAALSAFIPYWYGYVPISLAVKEAILTLLKYSACMLSATIAFVYLARYYFTSDTDKKRLHIFVGYTFVIWLLTLIVGNILPSRFAFVQFAPIYIIWIVYQARDFLKIPAENIFSYTVVSSVVFLGLPFIWDKIFGLILR